MSFERALKRPAILCALLLALCTLATYPFVEMGQCDDFAYVRSAKTLAETGHITYYGWASAMLGWQLALGALFIKLFGFSFTAPYVSVLLVGLATAFFLVPLLLPAVVFCGAGAAKAPTTSANDNAKTIPCFISPPESFESGQPVKYWCDLTCRTDGTVDASYSLLRIDEYSINLG